MIGAIVGLVIGVVVILVLGYVGFVRGWNEWADSPETKAWIEKQRKEKQRQEEWRRKVGGG